jgi:hypothetical protein
MQLITSLATKLARDFPNFHFVPSSEFRWSPEEMTVYFDSTTDDTASLLHELSHAQLGHRDYTKDMQLIEMERDAWKYAEETLSNTYEVTISDNVVEGAMDTYRDWLHARSTCPECQATGVQAKKYQYKCLVCGARWKVNDARVCALRRYKVT